MVFLCHTRHHLVHDAGPENLESLPVVTDGDHDGSQQVLLEHQLPDADRLSAQAHRRQQSGRVHAPERAHLREPLGARRVPTVRRYAGEPNV